MSSNKGLEDVTVECSKTVAHLLVREGYTMCKKLDEDLYMFRVTEYNQFYSKFINLANNLGNG